jgi:hypothetical protein
VSRTAGAVLAEPTLSREATRDSPADDAPEPDQAPSPAAPRPKRRLPRLAFLAVGLGLAYLLAPAIPRDHPVVLRMDDAASITGVELAWSRADDATSTPVRGGTWRFQPGQAPHAIETNARLPTGTYRLAVSVSRTGASTEFLRTITLDDGGVLTIPVR